MKRIFYLLMFAMCIGTIQSCDDEIEPDGIFELRDPKSDFFLKGAFYYFEKNNKNVSLRNRVSIGNIADTVLTISAVRDGKHWFGFSDDEFESFLFEWYDAEPLTDTLHTVYVGYGETETLHSEYLVPRLYKKYDNGEVLVASLLKESEINTSAYYIDGLNGLPAHIHLEDSSVEVGSYSGYFLASFIDKTTGKKNKIVINGGVRDGFNESILTDNACISRGDTLFTYSNLPSSNIDLISYCEGVFVNNANSVRIEYEDFKNNIKKEFSINPPFEIPSDAQPKYTVTYKGFESRILHYIIDVVYFDGTKKQFSVSINVDTDEITTD